MHGGEALSVRELLDALAAGTPAPGGGAAAALTGAIGASLLLMVARLPRKTAGPPGSTELDEASDALLPLREALIALIDRDAEAYAAVIRARALQSGDATEAARRRQVLDAATLAATETQLEVMRACSGCLRHAAAITRRGPRSAASDVQVAVELLRAAARAAALTVTANLETIPSEAAAARLRHDLRRLEQAIDEGGSVAAG